MPDSDLDRADEFLETRRYQGYGLLRGCTETLSHVMWKTPKKPIGCPTAAFSQPKRSVPPYQNVNLHLNA
jgi:hypothetical protein